ncbi:MAG: methyltransferase regulatory domain-containing protein [Planctomycetaceae bacterium]
MPTKLSKPVSASTKPTSTYDEVPYKSHPFQQSHPSRLATIARLFGLETAPITASRILELGCASGGNLIPTAVHLPESTCVGVDLSQVQITDGQAVIDRLQLKNIELKHLNLNDFPDEAGEFDYIIAHGIYSWVPDSVQERIFEICEKHLSENGVAYISYNTYPGWHMRGMIRDMMCYRTRNISQPTDSVRQARGLLDFLAQAVPTENNAYGIMLQNELRVLSDKEDYYLLHEHLEEHNDPVYFYQFNERAESHGLRYLGEADFGAMSLNHFSEAVRAMLRAVSSNAIEIEQYMDFVRNRMFRQTLLCRKGVNLKTQPDPFSLLGMSVSSGARPEQTPVNLRANDQTKFRFRDSVMVTSDGLVKAAMLQLQEAWPRNIPFRNLLAVAASQLTGEPSVVDARSGSREALRLAEPMMRCFATGVVDISVQPSLFTTQVSDKPLASPFARMQATTENRVTNVLHESVYLNDLQRQTIMLLDGNHTLEQIVDCLIDAVEEDRLMLHDNAQPVSDPARLRSILADRIPTVIQEIARVALLMN